MKNNPINGARLALTSIAVILLAHAARGVEINIAIDPPGPVAAGEVITVDLSVTNWDAADGEVDAVAFFVDFDTNFFDFVPGSGAALADGTEFLALPNQGAGYLLSDDSSELLTGFGRFIFGASDSGDATGGSVGPNGPLGSFQLLAKGAGTSSITPGANDPNQVFSDVDFFGITPAGGVIFNSTPVTVVPKLTITAVGLLAADRIFIEFQSTLTNTLHKVKSSTDLAATPFAGAVTISGGSLTTDGSGRARIEIKIDTAANPKLFYQIQF